MTNILVQVKDDRKAHDLIRFLKDIDYLDVVVQKEAVGDESARDSDLRKAFGIWADKDISLGSIREKAWR